MGKETGRAEPGGLSPTGEGCHWDEEATAGKVRSAKFWKPSEGSIRGGRPVVLDIADRLKNLRTDECPLAAARGALPTVQ